MQCPKCQYEPTLEEMQRSPNDCVKCGVNYQGHARYVANMAAQREGEAKRQAAAVAPHVRKMMAEHKGASPVVIVDFNMSFGSMVVFMIKWALAAIPAMIILFLIGAALLVAFGMAAK